MRRCKTIGTGRARSAAVGSRLRRQTSSATALTKEKFNVDVSLLRCGRRSRSRTAAVVAAGEAKAQANVLKECGSQYQTAKAANELKGQSWQDFLKACRVRLSDQPAETAPAAAAPAPTPAPAPAAAAPEPAPVPAPAPTAAMPAGLGPRPHGCSPRSEAGQAGLRGQGRPDRAPEEMRSRMEDKKGRAAEGQSQSHLAEILERVQQAPQSRGRVTATTRARRSTGPAQCAGLFSTREDSAQCAGLFRRAVATPVVVRRLLRRGGDSSHRQRVARRWRGARQEARETGEAGHWTRSSCATARLLAPIAGQ